MQAQTPPNNAESYMHEHQQEVIANVANKVMHAGGAVSVTSGIGGWLIENHDLLTALGVVIGIVLSIAGFGVNWYYRHKEFQRKFGSKPARSRKR